MTSAGRGLTCFELGRKVNTCIGKDQKAAGSVMASVLSVRQGDRLAPSVGGRLEQVPRGKGRTYAPTGAIRTGAEQKHRAKLATSPEQSPHLGNSPTLLTV